MNASATSVSKPEADMAGSWGLPSYRTVWRWHFYAGLFSIPFVLWLSVTGSAYLFRPQIEAWLDRPYDSLQWSGARASAEDQVRTALHAIPGSNLHFYQLPRTDHAAVQVVVGHGIEEYRVYVHPQTLQVLKVINEDRRPMNVLFYLHGELLMGDRGSMVVELAASWTIIMILTGLYLSWPRQIDNFAGILYIRLRKGQRLLFRDLHSMAGVWISMLALFLLLTGLPWAFVWGNYLVKVRTLAHNAMHMDWTTGRSSELARREAMNMSTMPGMIMPGDKRMANAPGSQGANLSALDRILPAVWEQHLAYPVLISPPESAGMPWTAKSDSQNRPLRSTVTLDGATGLPISRRDFNGEPVVDRIIEIGIAAHEGQLFGLANQLLGLFTAIGLVTLSVSAIALWWKRRAVGVLGAPAPIGNPRFSMTMALIVIALGIYLPMMGFSLIFVLLLERTALRRIPSAQRWLGLEPMRS
jgi:uncharacterized iron-regulated membrane protein